MLRYRMLPSANGSHENKFNIIYYLLFNIFLLRILYYNIFSLELNFIYYIINISLFGILYFILSSFRFVLVGLQRWGDMARWENIQIEDEDTKKYPRWSVKRVYLNLSIIKLTYIPFLPKFKIIYKIIINNILSLFFLILISFYWLFIYI